MTEPPTMPLALGLVALAGILAGVSGLPSLRWSGGARQRVLVAALAVVSATLGLLGVALLAGGEDRLHLPWPVPGGSLALALDGVSALFLAPVFLIFGLGSIYGVAYWRPGPEAQGRRLPLFYGLITAGMVLLLLARNGVVFLFGWETMAVAAFLLVATEHHLPKTRQTAWIYLAAAHAGTLCLLAVFALLRRPDGSLDWDPATIGSLSPSRSIAVFVLALIGFGLKAGVMPVHFWLPSAHAKSPSHVSAMLSGVMVKTGVYGLLRVTGMLPPLPAWCGGLVLGLGGVTALLGVAACLGQGDLKRLLAYSTIENVGIIFLGLGLAMLGRTLGEPLWVALGLGGALVHVLNHSVFKPLLFFAAGSVIHATGTRRIDAMGGLGKAMPRTALGFLVGAGAVSGLPLLNGFVGELLLYLGLFRAATGGNQPVALLATLAIAVLSMVGAIAVAVFVRAFGAVFLGTPRSAPALAVHESPPAMTGVLAVLALLCGLVGTVPFAITPFVDQALAALPASAPSPLHELAPLHRIAAISLAAGALLAAAALLLRRRWSGAARVGTWDCGYVDASSPRLQYTGSSLAQLLLRLLAWAVPHRAPPRPPMDLFAGKAHFHQEEREALLHGTLLPWLQRWAERCSRLRILQQGNVQLYLLYVLVVLMLLLGWSVLEAWLRA